MKKQQKQAEIDPSAPDVFPEMAACCSRDRIRPALSNPWVDPDGHVYATDGHVLIQTSARGLKVDAPRYIPVALIKRWRSCKRWALKIGNTHSRLESPEHEETAVAKNPTGSKPPAVAAVLADAMVDAKADGPPTISLNAELLLKLAKALNAGQDSCAVSLWVSLDPAKSIIVRPCPTDRFGVSEDRIGILMPIIHLDCRD